MMTTTTPIPTYRRVEDEDAVVDVVETTVVAVVETIVVGIALVIVDTTVEPPDVTVESTVEESVAVTVETETELDEELMGAASYNVSSQNTGLVSAWVL